MTRRELLQSTLAAPLAAAVGMPPATDTITFEEIMSLHRELDSIPKRSVSFAALSGGAFVSVRKFEGRWIAIRPNGDAYYLSDDEPLGLVRLGAT